VAVDFAQLSTGPQ